MEDARTSEEDDTVSQDSNTPIDHGHLARNCSIKFITPAVKASVISLLFCFDSTRHSYYGTPRRLKVGGRGIYTDYVFNVTKRLVWA